LRQKCSGFRSLPSPLQGRADKANAKVGFGDARFNDRELDIKMRDFLRNRLDEALNRPLGCVIQAEIWKGGLAAR
jgi:hypothetical protein